MGIYVQRDATATTFFSLAKISPKNEIKNKKFQEWNIFEDCQWPKVRKKMLDPYILFLVCNQIYRSMIIYLYFIFGL